MNHFIPEPLRSPQVGSAGQLQEWLEDWDMQAPEIHHRHVSHLFGLFPGHDIDVRRTPGPHRVGQRQRRPRTLSADQPHPGRTADEHQ